MTMDRASKIVFLGACAAFALSATINFARSDFFASLQALFSVLGLVTLVIAFLRIRGHETFCDSTEEEGVVHRTTLTLTVSSALFAAAGLVGSFAHIW